MPKDTDAPFPSKLADWIDSRQAQGLYYFTREEAIKNLQLSAAAFKMAVSRLQKKERIHRILRGFYIIICRQPPVVTFGRHSITLNGR